MKCPTASREHDAGPWTIIFLEDCRGSDWKNRVPVTTKNPVSDGALRLQDC